MEYGTTILIGNFFFAGASFSQNAAMAILGIAGLLANGVSVSAAFSYLRQGGDHASWWFRSLLLIAVIPALPLPLYWEMVWFFAPPVSILFAIATLVILRLSARSSSDTPFNVTGKLNINPWAFAIFCFAALALCIFAFDWLFMRSFESIWITAGLALPFAVSAFVGVRRFAAWADLYLIQLLTMAGMLLTSLGSQYLLRAIYERVN